MKKVAMPGLIAFLSLGFFSQSPVTEKSVRRVSSVECVNCAKDQLSPVSVPSIMPFFVNANFKQAENNFLLFSRQVEFQSGLNNLRLLNGFSRMFANLPSYPSYVLPAVADYQINLQKPAVNNQIFSGLTADPALRYLTQPGVDARTNPSLATGNGPKVLDVAAVLEANLGLAPSPNNVVSAKPIAVSANLVDASAAVVPPNTTVVPKAQDRLIQTVTSSNLLGSKPVKQPVSPQVSFSISK